MTKRAYGLPFVISAASAGTIVEWYDFYLYATLTPFLSPLFFPGDNPTAVQLAGFATYAAGFLVRPFGAVVFGALGDIIGRKYTFLVTITAMGLATVLMGLIPTYAQIGLTAPALLVLLRIIQGLALGGEYGGAAIYVAEHAPDNKRGLYTSWIQTTATLGFFFALAVILYFRNTMTAADFAAQGWRYPFWISAILVVIALFIRIRLRETPLFARLRDAKQSVTGAGNWASESFGGRKVGTIALVLLGLTAGQGVVWYQGQFQALNFLSVYLKYTFTQAYPILLWAVALGTPFFLVFGWLSDRVGSKLFVPFLKNFMALPIDSSISLRQFNTTNDPNGNIYLGLAYTITVALITVVVGTLFLKEPKGVKIWQEVGGEEPGMVTEATPAD